MCFFTILTGWELCLIWNAQCITVPPYDYYRLIFFKFQLNVKKENKIRTSKVSCTLYSVDCMQFVVSMFVLLMHLFKKCGVMINHSSINKNFRYTHFKNNLFDPLQTALVFTIMNFKERTYPDVAKIWICYINRIWWLAAISH